MSRIYWIAATGAGVAIGSALAQTLIDGPGWSQGVVALAMGVLGATWLRQPPGRTALAPVERRVAQGIALVGLTSGAAILAAWGLS